MNDAAAFKNSGIKMNVIEEIRTLAQRYDLEKLILFGSRARGDYHRASDIDLAVSGGDFARFAIDAEEDTSTLLFFDFVDLQSDLSAELVDIINKEGIVLYEKV